jgi:asparagine synthase (glutamine-hydrolysing)
MCGIAGMVFRDGRPVDADLLRAMGESLAHRGPDGEGFHVDVEGAPSVGLVNRRLAVIDVEDGDQPMATEDGAHTIVYNGELFNADEVRGALTSAGHRFRTRCDTEVVLRGYAEWGAGVLDRLNGMWAFAIWERHERRLFLARDRLGVKPLVYAETPEGLVFGSEIKALIASGLVRRELDIATLPHYLSFFAVPEPHSLVRGVRRLPAGHTLTLGHDGVKQRQYWDCNVPEEEDRGSAAYCDEVGTLFEDAVQRRLVSDVPLGALLSSGVDSSLMATLAARHLDEPLRTFTLGFGVPGADEREAARTTARAIGARHTEDTVGAGAVHEVLPRLIEAYDEPGQSLLQTHLVCQLARRDVTVALSGLGGDELFSGYPAHVVANLLGRLDRFPAPLRTAVLEASRLVPHARLGRARALAAMGSDQRAAARLMHQTDAVLRGELLSSDVRGAVDLDAPVSHLESHFARAEGRDPLNRMLYVYIKTYLVDELLRASDAMSMLNSLELRTPFLDYRLVELAMAMPARHKMRLTTGKLILRDVAAHVLHSAPPRRKQGFSPPLNRWVRDEAGESIRDVLSGRSVRARGIFDPATVESMTGRFIAGDDRMLPPVMMLYAFEVWARRWLDQGSAPPAAQRPVTIGGPAAREEGDCDLSVIIVNWNTQEKLHDCLSSIERHLAHTDHEVIVVDNDSSDGSPEMVAERFPRMRLLRNEENVGFGRANNQAMRVARGRWHLLLNSDTELLDDSVEQLVQRARDVPGLGVAHCKMILPDGRTQHSVYRFPTLRMAMIEDLGLYKLMSGAQAGEELLSGYWSYDEERDVDWVAGAFMLMPREVFETTGGFDERLFMYGEDLEWCYRIHDAGWRIRYFPDASIKHHDHASSELRWGDERIAICLRRQRDIFRERHGGANSAVLMALRITGQTLRTAYYSLRVNVGPRREAYRDMQSHSVRALRALLHLATRRG